jgi:hypothetical protein
MIDANLYIDDANKNLWETMNQSFNISINYSAEDCYVNYLQNGNCTIYVPRNKEPDTISFTHELLHLYLPYHETFIGRAIMRNFMTVSPFDLIFDKKLCDHISNSLEHIKMLPLYLKMGYPAERFISDYYDIKLTDNEVDSLCKNYKRGLLFTRYNKFAINHFIGKFFAVKADVNVNNQYDRQMSALKSLDYALFSALDRFWNSWIEYDVEKQREVWEYDYNEMVNVLVDDLTDWGKDKKIV